MYQPLSCDVDIHSSPPTSEGKVLSLEVRRRPWSLHSKPYTLASRSSIVRFLVEVSDLTVLKNRRRLSRIYLHQYRSRTPFR